MGRVDSEDGQATAGPNWLILLLVSTFFGVFLVNGALLYFALTSNRGMVETSPYEEGISYEIELDAQRKFYEIFGKPKFDYHRGQLLLRFPNRSKIPVKVIVEGVCLSDSAHDFVRYMTPIPSNEQVWSQKIDLVPGFWSFRLEIYTKDGFRLAVRGQKRV